MVIGRKVSDKGGKTRYVPMHPAETRLIAEYLDAAGRGGEDDSPYSWRCITAETQKKTRKSMMPGAVYRPAQTALGETCGAHSMRSTVATNARANGADIAKVRELLGHANIRTTRLYGQRQSRPEDSANSKLAD
jgi:integrase/recombinase XerD